MFKKVLIANRGTIACRVIRTLDRLGIASVAVYSEADRHSLHVRQAGEAVCLGPPPASESYLSVEKVLAAAKATGADAIHPGYGFLSENPEFAEACAAAGIAFVGPRPGHMRAFGLKHTAREIAAKAGVPLAPGTGLLPDADSALAAAEKIGFPLMLKSTGGGGGIGLQLVRSAEELGPTFERVTRLAQNNFKNAGVYLEKFVERGRHIEVQIFGDGAGSILALGERDCSAQRRNQKVVEETPAPNLPPDVRAELLASAVRLGEIVAYENAGTVEYLYDVDAQKFYFLEVNTRLQVEHGVTEEVFGIDLVEWMLRQAAGEALPLDRVPEPKGHSLQVRLYAENPAKDFRPSAGLLTHAVFPRDVRVETWVEAGIAVPPFYDPMIGKLIVHGETREDARKTLVAALEKTELAGIETNRDYLIALLQAPFFVAGETTTSTLAGFDYRPAVIEVVAPGTQTTVQDFPGRLGLWDVGVPPSGPMDSLSFRLANRAVGNAPDMAGLEITLTGPTLRFATAAAICLAGAAMAATLDGEPVPFWRPVQVAPGQTLVLGALTGTGVRTYLAIRGGIDVPKYLGSRSTFTLGKFGGHAGRALVAGDTLHIGSMEPVAAPEAVPEELRPEIGTAWTIGVLYGPHGAPDFFTDGDVEIFFAADFAVHFNSNRTGVRLIGPKPQWARPDGGEAGLHPSNIHDTAYAIGAIDFTGDLPVILGPDGPSLGGFVCPAVIALAELWKIGQLRPGDTVRFLPISAEAADALRQEQEAGIASLTAAFTSPQQGEVAQERSDRAGEGVPARQNLHRHNRIGASSEAPEPPHPALRADLSPLGRGKEPSGSPILGEIAATATTPRVLYRRAGDDNILVEYGPLVLDIELRFRVQALLELLRGETYDWVIDLTPGIRSLQVHFDAGRISLRDVLSVLEETEKRIPALEKMRVPSRTVRMPLSWDDPATQLAIRRYLQGVRPDAPWGPSNIEFIRRINGLDGIEEVKRIVFEASYLVLGLGDVYLGAPVATPLDPRHRLVTTKYNPARTWTPENAVGIGGAYMCIYGMEGPGGYQFVGRTAQVWNTFRATAEFEPGKPWLLRFFDQVRFFEIGAAELLEFREAFLHGEVGLEISEGSFGLAEYRTFLAENEKSIAAFRQKQRAAFEAERQRWIASGLHVFDSSLADTAEPQEENPLPAGAVAVTSPVPGSVWRIERRAGEAIEAGATLLVIESMKTEIAVTAPAGGVLAELRCAEGRAVALGQVLAVIAPAG